MGIGAAIGGVVSGIFSSNAAEDASDAQAAAAQQQLELEKQIYDETVERFQPYYNSGLDFQNALRYELLGGETPMMGGTVLDVTRNKNGTFQVGDQSFNRKKDALAYAEANPAGQFEYQGFQATPGYQFMLDQGQAAIDGSAAARGNVFSGATLKAQQAYGQGLANQEYGTYLDRLTGQASSGQAAAGNMATAGANYASGAGNALANMGNAQAAGYIGSANALTSGLSSGISGLGYMAQNQGWM